jgi:hypothetical protein
MASKWRQTYGVHPTLRHLSILVLFFALLSAMVVPALKSGSYLIASFLLPLSLPMLALLVMLLDKPGPMKIWLAGLLAYLFLPALVAWVDWMAAVTEFPALVTQEVTAPVAICILVLINVPGVLALYRLFGRLPRRCPECRLRALLPLGRLKWCAACGVRLEARR